MDTSPVQPHPPSSTPDIEHLRALSICHYVLAGLQLVSSCFPGIYMGLGILILCDAPRSSRSRGPDQVLGWIFAAGFGLMLVFMLTLGVLMFLSGRNLSRCCRWKFCFVVALVSCLMVPLGTILGVFTLIVLSRPSVKALFAENDLPLAGGGLESTDV